jgi:hypothetical protein
MRMHDLCSFFPLMCLSSKNKTFFWSCTQIKFYSILCASIKTTGGSQGRSLPSAGLFPLFHSLSFDCLCDLLSLSGDLVCLASARMVNTISKPTDKRQ